MRGRGPLAVGRCLGMSLLRGLSRGLAGGRRASDRLRRSGHFLCWPKESNQRNGRVQPGEGQELGAITPCRVGLMLLEELPPLYRGRSGAGAREGTRCVGFAGLLYAARLSALV